LHTQSQFFIAMKSRYIGGVHSLVLRAVIQILILTVAFTSAFAAQERSSVKGDHAPRDCGAETRSLRVALEKSLHNLDLELRLARALASCGQNTEATAWYRNYLEIRPREAAIWYELGKALARSGQNVEATKAFEAMLRIDPENRAGQLALARSLAVEGRYPDALRLCDRILQRIPSSYEALQEKAFALYWAQRFAEARVIFTKLATRNPSDPENLKALQAITRAQDEKRWKALRPASGSPAQAYVGYYLSYLEDHPHDEDALKNLAGWQARWGNFSAAIDDCQQALRLNPGDRAAKIELARILSWDRQFDASIKIYLDLLRETPRDVRLLEALSRVYLWSGNPGEALSIEQQLCAVDPQNIEHPLAVARLELQLKKYDEAEKWLVGLLKAHPQNREARLELAQLELHQRHLREALRDYDWLLGDDFTDADALYGEAQIYYYLGDVDRAYPFAVRLVSERPKDFDALLLMARIERARDHSKAMRAYLNRASQLNPSNPEIAELKRQIQRERALTFHTSASYVREVSFQNPFVTLSGLVMPGETVEDLNSYSGGVRMGFAFLPHSTSYISIDSMPSNSPAGGIQGTVAPAQLVYGQTTELSKDFVLRGGFGLIRMGPGELFSVAGQNAPVRSLAVSPIGYAGYSLRPNPKLSLDFTVSHLGITYTPASVRFGVMNTRIELAASYALGPRTRFRMSYYHDRVSSSIYDQVSNQLGGAVLLEKNGHDRGNGGAISLDRTVIRTERLSWDAGYSGAAFGYAGKRRGVFMGFFNPTRYQHHLVTSRIYGRFWGPIRYTLTSDIGLQQAEEGEPFTRALRLGPGLSFHLSPRSVVTLGYLHYDFAQSLGAVKGNAIQLSTDWNF
jgi:tetratricopeptide (TPR) repeat protein